MTQDAMNNYRVLNDLWAVGWREKFIGFAQINR
jgi:hypothetical protein